MKEKALSWVNDFFVLKDLGLMTSGSAIKDSWLNGADFDLTELVDLASLVVNQHDNCGPADRDWTGACGCGCEPSFPCEKLGCHHCSDGRME